jgi:hypothetical protein
VQRVQKHCQYSVCTYDSRLELLSKEFQEIFRDFSSFKHHFALFSAPFTFDVAKAEESLQMELLGMQSDSTLRAKYLVKWGYLISFHTFLKSLKTSESLPQ